jgi:hypothetical protein
MNKTLLLLAIVPTIAIQQVSVAQSRSQSFLCTIPLEYELLAEDAQPAKYGVVTADTISQTHLTIPSLWWAKEQFDIYGGRLISNWLAYPEEKRIDLIVNRQLWSFMDYVGRYRFVNELGTVARGYGYNLRVFNQQDKCLATYVYNPNSNPPKWEINFDSLLQDGLQIK